MKKQHILGFFDSLVRTPAFLFLCAMFLCGALAGGLTGLHASEGDSAVELTAMLAALPGQAVKSVLCAVLWVALPLVCVLLRPAAFFLSGLAAARGFVLALTVAVGVGREESLLLSLCAAGIPAVLSVSALLAACAMVWQSGEFAAYLPHTVCALYPAGRLRRAAPRGLCRAVEPVTRGGTGYFPTRACPRFPFYSTMGKGGIRI